MHSETKPRVMQVATKYTAEICSDTEIAAEVASLIQPDAHYVISGAVAVWWDACQVL